MSATTESLEHLQRVALPSSIGRALAPRLWGAGTTYRVDRWLAVAEQAVVPAILDKTTESFVMLNVPPQVGKSTFGGELLPFWVLGMFPETRIIVITYSDDFSKGRGATVRNMMEAFGPELFGVDVDPDFRSAGDWRIKGHRGGMLSVGIGSQITGRSGDLIIIDDVIKNAEEAASPTAKRKHLAEYDGTIRTRLQPGGMILITATRWAEDDLSGELQTRQKEDSYIGDRWEVMSFPAIAEPEDEDDEEWEDPLGRVEGEELECRFPRGHFQRVRNSIDSFTFSCLYQQRPSVRKGGMFPKENWRYHDLNDRPYMDQVMRVWDLAATENGGDWTVGSKVGKTREGEWYVLDVVRKRLNANDVRELVWATAVGDGFLTKIRLEESRDGAGKSVVEFYKADPRFGGYDIQGVRAEGQKESRATPYSALQNGGHFHLPDGAEWVKDFVDEHRQMMGDGRKPKHDDQIDTVAYAVLEMADSGPVTLLDPYDYVDPISEKGINDLWRRIGLSR
jgi:predicted phage terminase large subunit-like protein